MGCELIQITGSNAIFTLQQTLTLSNPPSASVWSDITNASPYTTVGTNTSRFFRNKKHVYDESKIKTFSSPRTIRLRTGMREHEGGERAVALKEYVTCPARLGSVISGHEHSR